MFLLGLIDRALEQSKGSPAPQDVLAELKGAKTALISRIDEVVNEDANDLP